MSCFFGHKFGKVTDGYQYCERCGIANKPAEPHPCENGHLWETKSELRYTGYCSELTGTTNWTDYLISQECTRCGEIRHQWKFGH